MTLEFSKKQIEEYISEKAEEIKKQFYVIFDCINLLKMGRYIFYLTPLTLTPSHLTAQTLSTS